MLVCIKAHPPPLHGGGMIKDEIFDAVGEFVTWSVSFWVTSSSLGLTLKKQPVCGSMVRGVAICYMRECVIELNTDVFELSAN